MQPQSRTLGFVRPSHRICAFRLIRFTAAESAVRPSTALLHAPVRNSLFSFLKRIVDVVSKPRRVRLFRHEVRLDTAHSASLRGARFGVAGRSGLLAAELQPVIRFLPPAFLLLRCRIMKKLNHAPDLTQRPPRSPRVRLGGYVVLPRILDKGRAEIAGTAGEFKYKNPGDYHWFRFTGITPEALKAEVATGKGDGEMLAWIQENAPNKRSPWEIQQWSAYFSERGPDSDLETLECLPTDEKV